MIGEAGLVFPEGDVAALRAALQRLIDEPGRRHELARRGRERFLGTYTQEQVARATVDVYRRVLAGSDGGADPSVAMAPSG